MAVVESIRGMEILDSRGRPTVRAACRLQGGCQATASVPSGASTGDAEAREMRDADANRYRGFGCLTAVQNINQQINAATQGVQFETQQEFDQMLLSTDGTPNKSRLGANAILACSLAFSRAIASQTKLPLYENLSKIVRGTSQGLPRPTINLFSGGKHAGQQVPIQDVLVVPLSTDSIKDSLSMTYEVYQSAADICRKRFQSRLLTADEGGLSPAFSSCEQMFETAVESIESAGLRPGHDMALAVDIAASHFADAGRYRLGDQVLDGQAMVEQLLLWCRHYPIISVEDGLAQEDWSSWRRFNQCRDESLLIVGDDLLCTNPTRIMQAIDQQAANALLLKVNQIGTLTEAAESNRLAREAGWKVVVSARSGETEDDWLADLAVGWGGDYIKVGSITQSERLAKYNRLLEIEEHTGWQIATACRTN